MVYIHNVLAQVVQDIKDQVGITQLVADRERIRLDCLLNPNNNVERHPSRGGSEEYDFHMRASAIIHRIQGHPLTPSMLTINMNATSF